MTTETINYEANNILEDEKDIDTLREQEYMKDLHMRHKIYLELIEEFDI